MTILKSVFSNTFRFSLLGVAAGLSVVASFSDSKASAAPSTPPRGVFYTIKAPSGTTGNFELYSITATDGPTVNTLVAAPIGSPSAAQCNGGFTCTAAKVNGISYDSKSKNVFFFDSNGASPSLYYAPIGGAGIGLVSSSLGGESLAGLNLTGAAFSNTESAIYAIGNGSTDLYRIPISFTGSTPVAGIVTKKTIPGIPFSVVNSSQVAIAVNYGDIAISGQTLYGFTTASDQVGRYFYSYDLLTEQLLSGPIPETIQSMQMAFSGRGSGLFGITAGTIGGSPAPAVGYIIGFNGSVSPSYASVNFGSNAQFVIGDIAGADTVVPGPLPLLGAAAAFRASRKLRKRVKGASVDPSLS